jgi:homoaconitase/3-isopropylmalate dehydratase large subunit
MGMTIIEKIMARHSDRERVKSGDYVTARIDQVCIYDSFIDIHEDMKKAGIEG